VQPQAPQQPQQPSQQPAQGVRKNKPVAIAALVTVIIGFAASWVPIQFISMFGFLLGVIVATQSVMHVRRGNMTKQLLVIILVLALGALGGTYFTLTHMINSDLDSSLNS